MLFQGATVFFVTLTIFISAGAMDVTGKIATNPACKDDVTRLCSSQVLPNDLAVLDCLQNRRSDSDADIKIECHSVCRCVFNYSLLVGKGYIFFTVSLAV
jgi:Golgi apparatus protein 1